MDPDESDVRPGPINNTWEYWRECPYCEGEENLDPPCRHCNGEGMSWQLEVDE